MEEELFEQRTDVSELSNAVIQLGAEIQKVIVGQDEMVR